jgi:hypothetical protein
LRPILAPLTLTAANDTGAQDATTLHITPGGAWKVARHLKPGDLIRTALNGRVEDGALVQAPGDELLTVRGIGRAGPHATTPIKFSPGSCEQSTNREN